jgi:iron complex outermembrane receptor protein
MKLKQWLVAGTVASLVVASGGALGADSLDEVVVTANKREQNVLDVSAAVSVVSGEAIREFSGQDVAALAGRIVGLQVQEYDLFPAFFIRGVGLTTETNDLNDQPVGTYLDEVYLGAPSLSRGQLFDVERLEVLRGPQGTLFGRNTSAGLIHYITRGPTQDLDGYAQLGAGSFGRITAEGAIGGPLGERVRGRVSGKYLKDDGYQKDRLTGQKFAQNDIASFRAQLAFDVTDNLELLTKLEYTKQDNTGTRYGFSGLLDPANPMLGCSPARVNAQQCVAANGFREPSYDPRIATTDDAPLDDLETRGATARLVYSGEAFTLTSITAWRDLERAWIADGDGTPQPFSGGAIRFSTFRTTDADQFSQELRLSGTRDWGNWVVGAYYYDDERNFLTSFPRVFTGSRTVSNLKTTSVAAFGQVDYRLSERWTLVGGLRYSDDDREITQVLTANLANPAVTVRDSEKVNDGRASGRVALEWRPHEGSMAYASYSTGFKSGTFAQSLNAVRGIDQVRPETSKTAEIGYKTQFWNGRAQTSIAAYNNRYSDFQATGSGVSAQGTPINLLSNVGTMEANGLEAELTLRATANLELNLGFTYTDTEISSVQNSGDRDIETNALLFYDGNPAPSTPETRLNGSLRWMGPASSVGKFGAVLTFNWQDDVNLLANANRYAKQEAYSTFDFTALWESADKRYYGQAFVQNLTDEKVAGWQFTINFVGTRSTAWGMPPRTYGVRFGVNF